MGICPETIYLIVITIIVEWDEFTIFSCSNIDKAFMIQNTQCRIRTALKIYSRFREKRSKVPAVGISVNPYKRIVAQLRLVLISKVSPIIAANSSRLAHLLMCSKGDLFRPKGQASAGGRTVTLTTVDAYRICTVLSACPSND